MVIAVRLRIRMGKPNAQWVNRNNEIQRKIDSVYFFLAPMFLLDTSPPCHSSPRPHYFLDFFLAPIFNRPPLFRHRPARCLVHPPSFFGKFASASRLHFWFCDFGRTRLNRRDQLTYTSHHHATTNSMGAFGSGRKKGGVATLRAVEAETLWSSATLR